MKIVRVKLCARARVCAFVCVCVFYGVKAVCVVCVCLSGKSDMSSIHIND